MSEGGVRASEGPSDEFTKAIRYVSLERGLAYYDGCTITEANVLND